MSLGIEPAASQPETVGRRDRVTTWGLTTLLVVLVLLPSANFAVFAGVPIASAPAYFGLVWLLVPLLLSGVVRRQFVRLVNCWNSRSLHAVLALMLVALIAKLLLLIGAPAGGFAACFRSLVPAVQETAALDLGLPARRCELSYSNPLGRFGGATRIDSAIDYGDSVGGRDWGLDFFNSTRFNYWAQWTGVPNRQYLPFAVTWNGRIVSARTGQVTVRYVGQGEVSIDASIRALPASYAQTNLVRLSVPAGRHRLSVRYAFTQEVIQPRPPTAPYAGIALTSGSGSSLQAAPVPSGWRVIADIADLMIAALLTLLFAAVLLATRGRIMVALLFGAGAAIAIRLPHADIFIGLVEFSAFLLVAWWTIRRRANLTVGLLTLYGSVLTIELERARHELISFGHVVLRSGGDDWLTYESQAHVVLAGSLRGGQSVFVSVPSFRYLLALGHATFGNGDGRVSIVVLAAIMTGMLSFALVLVTRLPWRPVRDLKASTVNLARVLPGAAMLLAVFAGTLLMSGSNAVTITRAPLTEPVTWALIPIACILFLFVRRQWAFVTGSALCGVALVTRIDQGVGLMALIGCGAVALIQGHRPIRQSLSHLRLTWAAALAVFATIALFPAAHNVYYGDRLRLVVDPGPEAANYAVPVADLPRICCSSAARSKFARQLRFLFVVGPRDDIAFVGPIRVIQALWLGALILTALRWKRLGAVTRLVSLLPAAFVLPQLFLGVDSYYPRHIVADYLVMALAAIYVFSAYRAEQGAGWTARSEMARTGPKPARDGL